MTLRDGLVAGAAGAVVGGAPSTLATLARRGDLLESTRAAGTLLLPGSPAAAPREELLVVAGLVSHVTISLGWGVVLARVLPRRTPVLGGAVAGLAIAALDLGVVGRARPRIRRLPLVPQLADHLAYGVTVGAVLARRG